MRFRFPKSARLITTPQFARVRKEGVSARGRFITLGVLKQAAHGAPRIGIITSRRVGAAVVRNRVRRRLREVVRLHRHRLAEGLWLVLVARRDAVRASTRELTDEWLRLADRVSILAEPR